MASAVCAHRCSDEQDSASTSTVHIGLPDQDELGAMPLQSCAEKDQATVQAKLNLVLIHITMSACLAAQRCDGLLVSVSLQ